MTLSTTILALFTAATAPVAPATAPTVTAPQAARAAAPTTATPIDNLRALVQGLGVNDTDLVSVLRDTITRR